MAPFLGGMRGLTVFVQDVRNCSNKVRATNGAREAAAAAVKAKARRAGDGGEDLPSTMAAVRRRARGGRREGRGGCGVRVRDRTRARIDD